MSGMNQLTVRTANGSASAACAASTRPRRPSSARHRPASHSDSDSSARCRNTVKSRPSAPATADSGLGSSSGRSAGSRDSSDRLGEK